MKSWTCDILFNALFHVTVRVVAAGIKSEPDTVPLTPIIVAVSVVPVAIFLPVILKVLADPSLTVVAVCNVKLV